MMPKAWSVLCAFALAVPAFAQGPVARLIVYRNSSLGWFAGAPVIYLDQLPLARLSQGRSFYLDVPPAVHNFRSGDRGIPYSMEFKPSQTYILRQESGGLVLMPNDLGLAEVFRLPAVSPDSIFDPRVRLDRPAILTPVTLPPSGVVLRNSDIIQMTRAGLSGFIIVRKIRETPANATDFKVGAFDLVQLAEANVNDMVINAMLDAAAAAAGAAKK